MKFNTGDKVRYVSAMSAITKRNTHLIGVTATVVEQTRHTNVDIKLPNGKVYGVMPHHLMLVEPALPPAPDSVLYFNSETYGDTGNDQRLVVGVGYEFTSSGNIFIGGMHRTDAEIEGFRHAKHGIGINLDADAALQLAHDLTRMAMELKRKEK